MTQSRFRGCFIIQCDRRQKKINSQKIRERKKHSDSNRDNINILFMHSGQKLCWQGNKGEMKPSICLRLNQRVIANLWKRRPCWVLLLLWVISRCLRGRYCNYQCNQLPFHSVTIDQISLSEITPYPDTLNTICWPKTTKPNQTKIIQKSLKIDHWYIERSKYRSGRLILGLLQTCSLPVLFVAGSPVYA